MQEAKKSAPIQIYPSVDEHRQAVLALRDLLIASDKYNRGGDAELTSAYHQARLVLRKNLAHLT